MERIKLIFSNSKLPFSWGVRLVTNSRWSHVAIIMDDDRIIESAFSRHGVKIDTLSNFKSRAREWAIVEIECKDRAAIIKAATSQVDRPYDWTALFGILFKNRNWQEDDSWFCSELVAYAFLVGGSPIINTPYIHRVTPEDVWKYPHRMIATSYI